jgi:hypothetical protein
VHDRTATQLIDRGLIKCDKLWPCLTTSNCCGSHKEYLKQKTSRKLRRESIMRWLKNSQGLMASDHYLVLKCKICPSAAQQCDKHTRALWRLLDTISLSLWLRLCVSHILWTWVGCVTRSTKLAQHWRKSITFHYYTSVERCISFQIANILIANYTEFAKILRGRIHISPGWIWCGLPRPLLCRHGRRRQPTDRRMDGYFCEWVVKKNCQRAAAGRGQKSSRGARKTVAAPLLLRLQKIIPIPPMVSRGRWNC